MELRLEGEQVDRMPTPGESLQVGDDRGLDEWVLEREVADV